MTTTPIDQLLIPTPHSGKTQPPTSGGEREERFDERLRAASATEKPTAKDRPAAQTKPKPRPEGPRSSKDTPSPPAESAVSEAADPPEDEQPATEETDRHESNSPADDDGSEIVVAAVTAETSTQVFVTGESESGEEVIPTLGGEDKLEGEQTGLRNAATAPADQSSEIVWAQSEASAGEELAGEEIVISSALATDANGEDAESSAEPQQAISELQSSVDNNEATGEIPSQVAAGEQQAAQSGQPTGDTQSSVAHKAGKTSQARASDDAAEEIAPATKVTTETNQPPAGQATAAGLAAADVELAPAADATNEERPAEPRSEARPANEARASEGLLSRLDRLQHTGAGRQQRAEAPGQPRIDAGRFVSRVTRAFQLAQERGGSLQMRLSPPELGSLRLEVSVQHGVLSASIDAETTAARNALLDNLPALRNRLAEQNIRIDRFDVDVRSDTGGNSQQFEPDQQQERHSGPPSSSNSRNQTISRTEPPRPGRTLTGDANLDLFI